MSYTEKLLLSAFKESSAVADVSLSKKIHGLALCSFCHIPVFFRKAQELEAAAWLTSDASLILWSEQHSTVLTRGTNT